MHAYADRAFTETGSNETAKRRLSSDAIETDAALLLVLRDIFVRHADGRLQASRFTRVDTASLTRTSPASILFPVTSTPKRMTDQPSKDGHLRIVGAFAGIGSG